MDAHDVHRVLFDRAFQDLENLAGLQAAQIRALQDGRARRDDRVLGDLHENSDESRELVLADSVLVLAETCKEPLQISCRGGRGLLLLFACLKKGQKLSLIDRIVLLVVDCVEDSGVRELFRRLVVLDHGHCSLLDFLELLALLLLRIVPTPGGEVHRRGDATVEARHLLLQLRYLASKPSLEFRFAGLVERRGCRLGSRNALFGFLDQLVNLLNELEQVGGSCVCGLGLGRENSCRLLGLDHELRGLVDVFLRRLDLLLDLGLSGCELRLLRQALGAANLVLLFLPLDADGDLQTLELHLRDTRLLPIFVKDLEDLVSSSLRKSELELGLGVLLHLLRLEEAVLAEIVLAEEFLPGRDHLLGRFRLASLLHRDIDYLLLASVGGQGSSQPRLSLLQVELVRPHRRYLHRGSIGGDEVLARLHFRLRLFGDSVQGSLQACDLLEVQGAAREGLRLLLERRSCRLGLRQRLFQLLEKLLGLGLFSLLLRLRGNKLILPCRACLEALHRLLLDPGLLAAAGVQILLKHVLELLLQHLVVVDDAGFHLRNDSADVHHGSLLLLLPLRVLHLFPLLLKALLVGLLQFPLVLLELALLQLLLLGLLRPPHILKLFDILHLRLSLLHLLLLLQRLDLGGHLLLVSKPRLLLLPLLRPALLLLLRLLLPVHASSWPLRRSAAHALGRAYKEGRVNGSVIRHLPACLRGRLGPAGVVRPDLVATDLGPKPPAAEVGPVALVPEVKHDIKAVHLRILLVRGLPVVITAQCEGSADDATHRGMSAAGDLDFGLAPNGLL
mmetsp:Transcript_124857/g.266444  ORF Transcript_124857/g.266444 Transcript_124857/m.266444 type:complete len:789 (+) Transcript_124857:571-2937(+)